MFTCLRKSFNPPGFGRFVYHWRSEERLEILTNFHSFRNMPTIKKLSNGFRFYFYSFDCNEPIHVHIEKDNLSCKFWIEPISLAANYGFNPKEINKIKRIIEKNKLLIEEAWNEHCGKY